MDSKQQYDAGIYQRHTYFVEMFLQERFHERDSPTPLLFLLRSNQFISLTMDIDDLDLIVIL